MSNKGNKKRIAFITRKMITGGVEKALLNMICRINNKDMEIDLYVENLGGDLFDQIPKYINVIEIPKKVENPILYIKKHPIKYANSIFSKVKIRCEHNYLKQCELTSHCLPVIEKKYDLAISYHAPNTVPVFYTINNINANKKVLWLHGDIITNNATSQISYNYFKKYHKIFGVSEYIKESLDDKFPSLASKTDVFYNFIDVEKLKKLSHIGQSFNDNFTGIRILTVGRLDYQKGYDLAVKVCYKLIQKGYNIKWYVCGEGNARKEIENLITKYNLKNHFILFGNKENPYGYIKDCDIYVQPSRFEGYCTTTNEARILLKPVVTTNVSGACEQFEDNKTGIITPITIEGIYEGVKKLIDSPQKRLELCGNLKLKLENKEDDIKKIMKILKEKE